MTPSARIAELEGALKLLFVGFNPEPWTAATRTRFARAGDGFCQALYLSGVIEREIDPDPAFRGDRIAPIRRRIGIARRWPSSP